MKILITGSSGLMGREIAYQLSKNKKYDLNLDFKFEIRNFNRPLKFLIHIKIKRLYFL